MKTSSVCTLSCMKCYSIQGHIYNEMFVDIFRGYSINTHGKKERAIMFCALAIKTGIFSEEVLFIFLLPKQFVVGKPVF